MHMNNKINWSAHFKPSLYKDNSIFVQIVNLMKMITSEINHV